MASRANHLLWAWKYAARRPAALGGVVLAMLLNSALAVAKPWPLVFLLDRVLPPKGNLQPIPTYVAWCIAATVAIFLLSWAANLAHTYANINLGQRMVYDLASDLFAKLQQLSLRFHTAKSVGDNLRRATTDCACVSVIITGAALPVVSSLLTLAAMFALLWRLDPTLTLLALAVVPFMIIVFYLYADAMTRLSAAQQAEEARIYQIAEQTFSAIPVIQAFTREPAADHAFAEACRQTVSATARLTHVQLRFKLLIGLAPAVGTGLILWVGGRQALAGHASMGAILLFLSYLASLYEPLATVMYTSTTIQGAAGSAQRVREILDTENDLVDQPGAVPLVSVQGRVQFENVTFGYQAGQPVLRGVSLEIAPGEIVALVGATGAGKSTFAALVPRFFDPWSGRVLLDGRDLRTLQLASLRRHVAIVPQEPFLFPLSIAENIAYGRPRASRPEIEAAAQAAQAHEFIQRLPQGYETIVGERGATLSGGERQRLSLARALLKDAPILILDEPTSALDAASETAVVAALERLARGRAVLVIAHRLTTIRRATRILVLQDGAIAESGSHDDLLRRGGLYSRLYALQFAPPPQA